MTARANGARLAPAAAPPRWLDRYLGIPFVDDGCGFDGCHCWGLVRLVYRLECGIELPGYGELTARALLAAARAIAADAGADPWRPAAHPLRPFDVLRMYAREDGRPRVIGHVGVMVDGFRVLHVERATDAVCVPLSHPSVRFRRAGAFRHAALDEADG